MALIRFPVIGLVVGSCVWAVLTDGFPAVTAFSTSVPVGRASTALNMASGLLDKLPKFPFGDQKQVDERPASALPSLSTEFKATPEGLVTRAKVILASDFGLQDESLLDENFVWIGPNLGSSVLGKRDFLAAGKFFNLRGSFPDLDYRGHDFRIDEEDEWTVRLTARMVGTMRGELRLRNSVLPPNGKQMQCPPEAISMTFDPSSGKLVKLCSGFAMDRQAGNTFGLCGVMAAAAVAGSPPSDWEIYPATTVIKRFFGRPVSQLPDPPSVLAPFPETVMIQLAKGILSADMAADDPDLLASSFTYCGQYDGPISKNSYLENVAQDLFAGVEPELSYFRVDPYDPYRVWVDVRPKGTAENGASIEGPPQAMSFTFDDDGFCTRLTAGAVMDPSIGNTGGLGGAEGIKFAAGEASPGIISRPLPQVFGRLRKRLLSPITKIGVDEYVTAEIKRGKTAAPKPVKMEQPPALPKIEPPQAPPKPPASPVQKAAARVSKPPPKQKEESSTSVPMFFANPIEKLPTTRIAPNGADTTSKAAAVQKAKEVAAAKKKKAEEAAKAAAEKKEQQAKAAAAAAEAKAQAAAQAAKKRADEAAKRAKAEADRKAKIEADKKARASAVAAQKAKAAKQPASPAMENPLKNIQFTKTISLPKITQDQDKPMKPATAPKKSAPMFTSRTISLPKITLEDQQKKEAAPQEKKAAASSNPFASLFSAKKAAPATKKKPTQRIVKPTVAPKGVPTLAKWRQNRDGSVTGFISGSEAFEDGQRITTSTIATGDFEPGTVVKTESGSRYFLE